MPSLSLQRVYRSRSGGYYGSIGYNHFLSTDLHLRIDFATADGVNPTIRLFDPVKMSIKRFFVEVAGGDTAVDGVFRDTVGLSYDLRMYDAAGALCTSVVTATTLVVTDNDKSTATFEIIDTGAGSMTRFARLVRRTDRNGVVREAITYTFPAAAATADCGGDRLRLWQIATVAGADGAQATFTYDTVTKRAGRFAVTKIDLPNGTSTTFTYSGNNLSAVGLPGGGSATFVRTTDTALQKIKTVISDPMAPVGHQFKTVWWTGGSFTKPDGTVIGQVEGQTRRLDNGAGETAYVAWSHPALIGQWASDTFAWTPEKGLRRFSVTGGAAQATGIAYAPDFVLGQNPASAAFTMADTFTNDGGHELRTGWKDRQGRTTATTFDYRTRKYLTFVDLDGKTHKQTLSAWASPLTYTDPVGRVTTYAYDARGNRLSKSVGSGTTASTWRWEYDARGLMTAAIDANGNRTDYQFSPTGKLVGVVEPADVVGGVRPTRTFEYDALGRLTAAVDQSGRRLQLAYDQRNRVVSRTYADTSTELITYGTGAQSGLVVSRTDRNGVVTALGYDAAGRLVRTEVAAGRPEASVDTCTYLSGSSTLKAICVRDGDTTAYSHDKLGRLVATTVAPSTVRALTSATAYDLQGRVTAVTDPFGRSTHSVLDTKGRLVRSLRELVPGAVNVGALTANVIAANASPLARLDIGSPVPTGAVTATGSGVSLSGGGADIAGTTDQFSFYRQSFTGGGAFTVRLTSLTLPDPWTKVGVMLRSSDAANAGYVFLLVSSYGVSVQQRAVDGWNASGVTGSTVVTLPIWLRLERVLGTTVASWSSDGTTWTALAAVPQVVTASSRIGLAVCSHKAATLATAVFDTVAWPAITAAEPAVAELARVQALLGVARPAGANPAFTIEERSYDASGAMLTMTDGRGIVRNQSYDNQARLSQVTEAAGLAEAATTSFLYDAQGNQVSVTNPRGAVTTTTRTGRNRPATVTEAAGAPEAAATRYTYTPTGKVATVTDSLGRTTVNGYGTCCDRLATVTDAAGFVTSFSYDFVGNRTAVTDANGLVTTTAYDGRNRPVRQVNGAGEVTVIAYADNAAGMAQAASLGLGAGADGSAVSTTDSAGNTSVVIRDGVGRVIRQVDALGHAVTSAYDQVQADGGITLVATVTIDALGQSRRSLADGAGRARVQVDVAGQRATASFDANGNRVAWRDANGVGQDCTIDARNREVTCVDTGGTVKRTTYDADGNSTIEVDGLGAPTNHTYDLRNRKVSTRDRIGAVTVFAYDAVGNLLSITDAEGKITRYGYDARNLLVREQFPDGQQTAGGTDVRTYTYDAGRRLRTRTDQAGVVTTYAYDAANRLTSRQYGGGTPSDSFAYDAVGRLVRAESGQYGVVATRGYDAAGRLTREAQVIDGLEFPVSYTYDAVNRVVNQTYPDGTATGRGYAPRGELTSVTMGAGAVASRTYDAGGRLIRTDLGNGVVETRTYAPGDNTVASIAAVTPANQPITAYNYAYDANKRKTVEADAVTAAGDQRFGYDQQDRLTAWRRGPEAAPVAQQSWSLTPVGDWLSTTRDGVVEARTHTDVHEVATVAGAALTYDAKGNLTSAPDLPTLGWDVENRLRSAQGNGPAGAIQASYRYDALGRRVQKVVNGKATTYLSAGAQTVVEVVGKLLNAPWINPLPELIPPATSGAPTGSILAQTGAGVVRVNFQPASAAVPVGWEAETGAAFAAQPSGHRFGWGSARTWSVDREALDVPTWDTAIKLADDATGPADAEWSVELPNGNYPVIVILGDAASREQTNTITINGQVQTDATPWVAGTPVGYEQGAFDGYAVMATVSDGRLRIRPVEGQSWNAKLCCIEIGAQGTIIDAATRQRLADTVAMMNQATGGNRGTTPAVKKFAYGTYVDEVLAYEVTRKEGTQRYFAQSNHLYSPAALTDRTGAVVERMTYDAYGKQAVMMAAGTTLAKSAVGFDRGFTGRIEDDESGLMCFRTRIYSPKQGRFISRDMHRWMRRNINIEYHPTPEDGYVEGYSLYVADFVPIRVDPYGEGPISIVFPGAKCRLRQPPIETTWTEDCSVQCLRCDGSSFVEQGKMPWEGTLRCILGRFRAANDAKPVGPCSATCEGKV